MAGGFKRAGIRSFIHPIGYLLLGFDHNSLETLMDVPMILIGASSTDNQDRL